MAFGFNFNKAKVLAAAEKFVQQGKLPNAIAEYEKIIQEDPKDLTVLNTIGDLSQRVGQNDQAALYFKRAGDQYAQDGFTVKAIAIYKKITRIKPGDLEYVSKLAGLYSQQGLMSDARSQYMQVADHYLKTGDNAQGARILQRILELDPENTATKTKLADLYMKLGRKDEASNIYYTAAESHYARGAFDAAEEALDRVTKMDPENTGALMLRGMIAVDSGDNPSAIRYLQRVPDLESRADGLRALLRAKLAANSGEGLEKLAANLLDRHNDLSGIRDVAGWYLANKKAIEGLRLYEDHIDQIMAADRQGFQQSLPAIIARIKDDAQALSVMLQLLEKSGDSGHVAEIMELQAHASAQKGKFQDARDLYQKLTDLEPDNALHQQSYKQMQVKLGQDPASRNLSSEEASQAFMVEALEEAAPAVHQNYEPSVEKAIEAALTDAELFVSYNVPAKAIPPLEAVLPMAPRDVMVNQRLATLYARGGRYGDAARTCQTLSEIYRERGHEKEAAQYMDAAQTYALRAPKSVQLGNAVEEHPSTLEIPAEQGAPSVQEFSFDVPDHLTEPLPGTVRETSQSVHEVKIEAVVESHISSDPALGANPPVHEVQQVDVSSEWEDMLTVEGEHPTAIEIPAQEERVQPAPTAPVAKPVEKTKADPAKEKISEIQFYIDQMMWDLAKKAILDLTEIAPDAPEITSLISAVSAGQAKASGDRAVSSAATPAAEFIVQSEEKPAAHVEKKSAAVDKSPLPDLEERSKPAATPAKTKAAPPAAKPVKAMPESPLDDILDVPTEPRLSKAAPVKKEEIRLPVKDKKKDKSTEDILSDFVGDLEKTELADFAPKPKKEMPAQAKPPSAPKVSPPVPAKAPPAPPVAARAAAASAPARETRAATNGSMRGSEANSLLTDILAELQEENVPSAQEESDPETHYNLGIAFKEMGLLDEAIGELQKVCHAITRGTEFSQPIQAYTWLAQCLVDKGAPEAAVRWYQQALQLSGLDDSSRCAIYYDLAAAYEASGDDKSALANFMEVYGSNIDFRDVASRIKALKS